MTSTPPNNGLEDIQTFPLWVHMCPKAARFKMVTTIPKKSAFFSKSEIVIIVYIQSGFLLLATVLSSVPISENENECVHAHTQTFIKNK